MQKITEEDTKIKLKTSKSPDWKTSEATPKPRKQMERDAKVKKAKDTVARKASRLGEIVKGTEFPKRAIDYQLATDRRQRHKETLESRARVKRSIADMHERLGVEKD